MAAAAAAASDAAAIAGVAAGAAVAGGLSGGAQAATAAAAAGASLHAAPPAAAAAGAAAAAAAGGAASASVVGLLLALAAAAGNNLGKGLQKAATRSLPALTLSKKEVVLAYLSSPVWLCGFALDVAGGAAMLAALASAPVSLVQPVAAFGLVLLAAFSHFVLQERLSVQQWQGAAVATCGIVGMGISSSSSSSSGGLAPPVQAAAGAPLPTLQGDYHSPGGGSGGSGSSDGASAAAATAAAAGAAAATTSPARVLFWFLLLLAVLGAEVLARQRRLAAAAARRRRMGGGHLPAAAAAGAMQVGDGSGGSSSSSGEAAVLGLEAGCCFGFSAAAARTGFQLGRQLGAPWLLVPLGIAASAGLTSSGFILQTQGFKHGSALVVCTTAAAASIVAGVALGLVALGERLPAQRGARLLLVLSWAAVAAGVGSMAGGGGGGGGSSSGVLGVLQLRGAALARALLLLLPRAVRQRLPRAVTAWLGRGAHVPGGLGFGVYLRQVVWGSSGSRVGAAAAATASSAGGDGAAVYDRAAVDEVLRGFGFRGDPMHDGPGLPVVSAADGGGGAAAADFGAVLGPMGGRRL